MSERTAPTAAGASAGLLAVSHEGAVTHVRLARPAKRNALNDALVGTPCRRPSSACPRRRGRWC